MVLPSSPVRGPDRGVVAWLAVLFGLVLAMVMVGGITRLTGSGLSMVEWRPLMGALPPMGDAEWQVVFDAYKTSPQYQLVNHWMTLADFKTIFFWEYFHRLMGRLIGVAFFLPWLWFVVRRRLRGRLALHTATIFVLGGLQGLLGWYMVKSGLADEPAVSHYRLAAHLMLAFLVGQWILWTLLDLVSPTDKEGTPHRGLTLGAWAVVATVAVQCVWGAFMAGKRAGTVASTFPDMNGEWIPLGLGALDPAWINALDNPVAIYFVHRVLGYVVVLVAALWSWRAWRRASSPRQRRAAGAVGVAALAQFALGALTVIWSVPVSVATVHQGGALVLLSLALYGAHAFSRRG